MIKDCLESLCGQLRTANEIIIIDNNCTDRTIEIAQRYDVRIIAEPKQGIWAARATGYDAANGDIIVCTDADARFPAAWLQNIERGFENPNVAAVCGPGKFYDGNWLTNRLGGLVYMQPYFWLVGSALATKPLFGSNFAMRATVWQRIRGEVHSATEAVFDDIDTSFHVLRHGRIRYDRRTFNYISIRPLRDPRGMLRRYKKGFRSIVTHWPEQAPPYLYVRRLRNLPHFW